MGRVGGARPDRLRSPAGWRGVTAFGVARRGSLKCLLATRHPQRNSESCRTTSGFQAGGKEQRSPTWKQSLSGTPPAAHGSCGRAYRSTINGALPTPRRARSTSFPPPASSGAFGRSRRTGPTADTGSGGCASGSASVLRRGTGSCRDRPRAGESGKGCRGRGAKIRVPAAQAAGCRGRRDDQSMLRSPREARGGCLPDDSARCTAWATSRTEYVEGKRNTPEASRLPQAARTAGSSNATSTATPGSLSLAAVARATASHRGTAGARNISCTFPESWARRFAAAAGVDAPAGVIPARARTRDTIFWLTESGSATMENEVLRCPTG